MNTPINAVKAVSVEDMAIVISTPRKSNYQFFILDDGNAKASVAKIVREIMPEAKRTNGADPKKELVFKKNHPYAGWLGFNLPGTFEVRKAMANQLFRIGHRFHLAVELETGGLRPLTNKHDHTGSRELPENKGGCAGCLNKDVTRCVGCPDTYMFVRGNKVDKVAFSQHTSRRK